MELITIFTHCTVNCLLFMRFGFLVFSALLLLLVSCGGNGNEHVKEGVLTFAIDYPDSKDNFFLYHVLPKEMKASFKDNKMELKIKKANLENTIVIDGKAQSICAFYDYGEKFSSNLNDADELQLLAKQPNYKVRFTKETDTLAGFNIKKAIVTDPNRPNEKIEVWYTKDIVFKNPNWFNGFEKIPGVMLKYSVQQYGMKMEFKAKKFEAVTVPDSVVMLSRPGKLITHAEFDKKIVDLFDSFN